MQIFDRKLKKYFTNYILQSLLATITLIIILYFENIFTNTEHPPAAGTALGITIQGWSYSTILVILITISLLSLTKYLLKPWLKDLV
jgi:hypothetical protein